jgi:hypothetical protein
VGRSTGGGDVSESTIGVLPYEKPARCGGAELPLGFRGRERECARDGGDRARAAAERVEQLETGHPVSVAAELGLQTHAFVRF